MRTGTIGIRGGLLALAAAILLAGAPLAVFAADRPAALGFTIGGGGAQCFLNPKEQPWALGHDLRAGLDLRVGGTWRFAVSVDRRRFFDDTTTTAVVKFPDPGKKSSRRWTGTVFTLSARRLFFAGARWHPFLSAGFGLTNWHINDYKTDTVLLVRDDNGKLVDYEASEWHGNLGLGVEYDLSRRFAVRAGLDFSYLTGLGTSFAKSVDDYRTRGNLLFSLGVTGYIGRGVKPQTSIVQTPAPEQPAPEQPAPTPAPTPRIADADADGVPDSTDLCPDTPAGVPVDESGCPKDSDGDGISDVRDRCAETPRGAFVDSIGCPLDSDADGVFDGLDFCPGTPAEWRAQADEHGCVADGDSDGVPDFLDRCPDTKPGTPVDSAGCVSDEDQDRVPDTRDLCAGTPAGLAVDENGCLVMTQLDRTLLLFPDFEPGLVKLEKFSTKILDDLAVRLSGTPSVKVRIRGYTDNVGEPENNSTISQRRADMARQYLIDRGIEPDRITAVGLGEVDPIADNSTAAGRKRNRRLEITFQQ